jgi:hypothetical protein
LHVEIEKGGKKPEKNGGNTKKGAKKGRKKVTVNDPNVNKFNSTFSAIHYRPPGPATRKIKALGIQVLHPRDRPQSISKNYLKNAQSPKFFLEQPRL